MRLVLNGRPSDDGQLEKEAQPNGFDDQKVTLHLLPCKIHACGETQSSTAAVDRYFRPYAGDEAGGESALWRASIRGKPLTGVGLDMPDGYVGVLCDKSPAADADLVASGDDAIARRLMYWNWDRVPTREDPLLSALDWVRVSDAIMSSDD